MSMIQSDLLLGQEGGAGYAISRSLRFNSSDSAYLSRVVTSGTNRKTFTFAAWVKRSKIGSGDYYLFHGVGGSGGLAGYTLLGFTADQLWFNDGFSGAVTSTAKFRDPSAWYHVVFAIDSTQATDSNRVKIYVNGAQITSFSSAAWPSLNRDFTINAAVQHTIGWYFSASNDFYLADIHFIDGQALTPSSFGEFDANGIWQPKAYTGTYGTNGFKLDFADNSSNTATTLGKDTSGNGNNWTPNNLSIGGISYSSATNGNTPVYDIQIGPTNDLSGTYVWSNAFDANGSTIGLIGPITFINTKPTWSTSAGVEVMAAGNGITATVNGGTQVACTNGGWTTISTGSSGTLNSIWVYSSAGESYFYGVRVDGVEIAVRRQIDDNKNNDSLVDSPTNYGTDTGAGGEVRGNYCTANPLKTNSGVGFANGNLDLNATAAGWFSCYSTFGITTGKWYWEAEMTTNTSAALNAIALGICPDDTNILASYVGSTSDSYGVVSNGNKWNSASQVSYGSSFSAGDIVMVAFDDDNGKIWFGKNGTWFASGNPAAGTNAAYTSISATRTWIPVFSFDRGRFYCNFGQRPFAYTAPSGFKALCTTNLPTPTGVVAQPSTAMDVKLYTGNGSTNSITGLGFSPDLVWIKARSIGYWHRLIDSVRGAQKFLYSNVTDAEGTSTANDIFTSFDSTGFTLGGADPSADGLNQNTLPYVAWCFDAGSSTVTNTQGSITSSVRANASAGFSVVTWSKSPAGAHTVGHGIGAPQLVIVKSRSLASEWAVYHSALGATKFLKLNTTDAAGTVSAYWNDTAPTSTTISLGSWSNLAGDNVAYCFAPVAGYSAMGSYVGNGSASDGPFVYTGFRPRWVMLKNANQVTNWYLLDSARNTYNVVNSLLRPNLSNAELSSVVPIDFLSNGFKIRDSDAGSNANGEVIIYAAFSEACFQFARAR
jgi:hypothetical protein